MGYSLDKFLYLSSFFIIFGLVVFNKANILASKPLVFLGTISYSLYLIHQNIGYIIMRELYQLNYHSAVGIGIALVSSIVIASLLVKYIERPSMTFLKKIYKKRQETKLKNAVY